MVRHIDTFELDLFHEQLILLIETGLPLPTGIRNISRNFLNVKFRQSLHRIADGLEEGESLSDVLLKEKKFFSSVYIALIRIGEKGGKLNKALQIAIDYERYQYDFRNKVKDSCIRPLYVFIFASVIYLVTMTIYSVNVLKYYHETGMTLPAVLKLYNYIISIPTHNYIILISIILVGYLLFQTKYLRFMVHSIYLKMPLLKRVLVDGFIASFSEGMAFLLRANIPLPESLFLIAQMTNNQRLAQVLENSASLTSEGMSFTEALSSIKILPRLFLTAVASGEKGGVLPDSLDGLAKVYRIETEYHSQMFIRALEVSLIIIVGLWVLVLAMLMFITYLKLPQIMDFIPQW